MSAASTPALPDIGLTYPSLNPDYPNWQTKASIIEHFDQYNINLQAYWIAFLDFHQIDGGQVFLPSPPILHHSWSLDEIKATVTSFVTNTNNFFVTVLHFSTVNVADHSVSQTSPAQSATAASNPSPADDSPPILEVDMASVDQSFIV